MVFLACVGSSRAEIPRGPQPAGLMPRRSAARLSRWRRRPASPGPPGAAATRSEPKGESSSTRSAREATPRARRCPSASTDAAGSPMATGIARSRSPAVSTRITGQPPSSAGAPSASRVVPGRAVTAACSSPSSALKRVDLPAFTGPTIATTVGVHRRTQRRPSAASAESRCRRSAGSASTSSASSSRRAPAAWSRSTRAPIADAVLPPRAPPAPPARANLHRG